MKKILIVLAIIMLIYVINNEKKDYYIIPDESIRFRVIANSNSYYDQYVKNKVKENLEQEFINDIDNSFDINESRKAIINNLSNYEKIVLDTLKEEEYNIDFDVNYGLNYFPEKEYKGVIYEEGEYESLVVTLGSGEGCNFWCVLFPPICSLEVEEETDIEYKFLIKDIFDKYILGKNK